MKKSLELKNNANKNFHLVFDNALNFALFIGFLATVENGNWALYALSQIILCSLYFRAFTLLHDASHGVAHSNKFLNDAVGFVSSIFCVLPYWPWRMIHLEHHKWTGNLQKDPVLLILRDYPNQSKAKKLFMNFAWTGWIPYLAFSQYVVFWKMGHIYFKKSDGQKNKSYTFISYFIMASVYLSTLLVLQEKALLYFFPGFFMYLVAVEVINMPHHMALNNSASPNPQTPLRQHPFCRSCHHSWFFSYFFLCNFNYHTEHHMFPYLPWYQLHKIIDATEDHLGQEYNKSEGYSWIFKNRNKDLAQVMYGDVIEAPAHDNTESASQDKAA